MLHHHTIDQLKNLKLNGMVQSLEEQLAVPDISQLSFEERIGMLTDREISFRDNKRLGRLLTQAKLKHAACVEDIDYNQERQLDKKQILGLSSCQWIHKGYNLLITGATGCGKTWLACALGNQACRIGLSVSYMRMSKLCEQLRIAQGDGSFQIKLTQLAKINLLIIDDFGLSSPSQIDRNNLLELIDDRNNKSTIITSQLPVEHWHNYIGESTLADAILDRLTSNCYQLNLKGESLRKKKQALTNTN